MAELRIRCAVCNKLVDRWEMWEDPCQRRKTLRVFCHGDTDDMELRAEDVISVRNFEQQITSQEGVAFTRKRLDRSARCA